MNYRNDCRHFVGEKPCKFHPDTAECTHFEPFGTRILIIKLGATGDVLRTTPLLTCLKQRHPQSHITWLVDPVSAPLLTNNPLIDKVLVTGLAAFQRLMVEQFDLLICLDKVDNATALAAQVKATTKMGFGMTWLGTLEALNPEAQTAMLLGISNQFKFRENTKPYQQITLEALGFEYQQQEYLLPLEAAEVEWAQGFAEQHALAGLVVGINTGSGPSFAGKSWRLPRMAELCRRLHAELGARVLLLGGPDERRRNEELRATVEEVVDTGCDNSLPRFGAIVNLCDVVVTGDTTAMHIAIALRKRVAAIFGSTCAQEIDLYGRGVKIVSQIDCAPCYLKRCPIGEICMDTIATDHVFDAVAQLAAP